MHIFWLAFACIPPRLITIHPVHGFLHLFSYITALIICQEIPALFFEGMCAIISPLLFRAPAEWFQFQHELPDSSSIAKNPSVSLHLVSHSHSTHSPCRAAISATIILVHPLLKLVFLDWKSPLATAELGKE